MTTIKASHAQSHPHFWVELACLALGTALVIWGVAPALVHRMITGNAPTVQILGVGSASLAVGAMYLGLHLLIRQGARYAIWLALGLAALMLLADLGLWIAFGARYVSSFVLLLAGAVAATAVLALTAPETNSEALQ